MAAALKCSIKDVLSSRQGEEFFVRGRLAAKVNVVAALISKDSDFFLVDDGSGTIEVRSFGPSLLSVVEIGGVVNIIGRVRFFASSPYLSPDIVAKSSAKMLAFRRLELERELLLEAPKKEIAIEEIVEPALSDAVRVREIIRALDEHNSGKGADLDEVSSRADVQDAEGIVRSLIEMGEVFEIRPGRLKVLE